MLGLMCPIGRSRSPGIRLRTRSAIGVKRRIRKSLDTITMAIWTLASRFTRSLLTRLSSSLRPCSSSLSVFSSSLVDWSSSFAVSSSSFVLCSSSLLDRISSLADCSSSLAASSSWMIDCRYSRLAASSRSQERELRLALARPRGRLCRRACLARRLDGLAFPSFRILEQHQIVRAA